MVTYVIFTDEAWANNKIIVKFKSDKIYDDFESKFKYKGGINNFFSEPVSRELGWVQEHFPSLKIISGANSEKFYNKLYKILYNT